MTTIIRKENKMRQVNAEPVAVQEARYKQKLLCGQCPRCGGDLLYYLTNPWIQKENGKRYLSYVVENWECRQCWFVYKVDTQILRPIEKSRRGEHMKGNGVNRIAQYVEGMVKRLCLCGIWFQPTSPNHKYCSEECGIFYRRMR